MGLKTLLKNLANGVYDGAHIDNEENGVSWGFSIKGGTPVQYREGKSRKFFNGKENEYIPGKRRETRYETDEEKDMFFKKYGFLKEMFGSHKEVMDYSRDYYEKKKK